MCLLVLRTILCFMFIVFIFIDLNILINYLNLLYTCSEGHMNFVFIYLRTYSMYVFGQQDIFQQTFKRILQKKHIIEEEKDLCLKGSSLTSFPFYRARHLTFLSTSAYFVNGNIQLMSDLTDNLFYPSAERIWLYILLHNAGKYCGITLKIIIKKIIFSDEAGM